MPDETITDTEINAAHPLRTGLHDLYAQAESLVHPRHSKYDLVDLVNCLLAKLHDMADNLAREKQETARLYQLSTPANWRQKNGRANRHGYK